MELADLINEYADEQKPWIMAKEDRLAELNETCLVMLNGFRLLTLYIKPVMPELAAAAEDFLNIAPQTWESVDTPILPGHGINRRALEMGAPTRRSVVAILQRNLDRVAVDPPPSKPSVPHELIRRGDYYDKKEMETDEPRNQP